MPYLSVSILTQYQIDDHCQSVTSSNIEKVDLWAYRGIDNKPNARLALLDMCKPCMATMRRLLGNYWALYIFLEGIIVRDKSVNLMKR